MNIFESYLKEIFSLIKKNKKELDLKSINDFKGVNLEIPPLNIDSDLSSNLCMILAKVNKMDPKKRTKTVSNARDYAYKSFNFDEMLSKYEALFPKT